jgi:hypothetical protein
MAQRSRFPVTVGARHVVMIRVAKARLRGFLAFIGEFGDSGENSAN